jgi:hypothetical protein
VTVEEFEEEVGEREVEEGAASGEEPKRLVKYCPLYSAAFEVLYPCIEEKCAWWDAIDGWCILISLKYEIREVAGEIAGP